MPRLPQPGSDSGSWGDILNAFLLIGHHEDGSIKNSGVIADKYVKPGAGIPESDLDTDVQNKLNNGGVSDADTNTKGVLQLAGDLSGTAAAPVVATGAITASKIANTTITNAQIAAGAAIDQSKLNLSLTKNDVGLANVPNTDATLRANHTGTQSADTLTDGTTNKAFLATERTKLTSLASAVAATDGQILIAQGDGTSNWEDSIDIANVPAASPLDGTEEVLAIQDNSNVLITTQNIADLSGTGDAVLHADIASNGLVARTAAETYASRTITGTASKITVTNGDGVAGDPTITIPDSATLVTPTIASFTNAQHTHANAAQGGTIPFSSITSGTTTLGNGSLSIGDLFGPPIMGLKAAVADTQFTTVIVSAGIQLGPGNAVADVALNRTAANTFALLTGGTTRFTVTGSAITTALPLTVVQPTIGNAAHTIQSTATNDDPAVITYQNRAATTDATVTTLHTATIPASTTVMLTATVVARRTGGVAGTAEDGASYIIAGTFKNVAGTATQIGTTTSLHSNESQAGWDCTFDVTGATARVRVTGATNNNITWHLSELKWMQVSS